MLQIKSISKQYQTGELVQQALDQVSLNLRDHEFVCILGPSGSGKTTLLNVIGGLDRYDSGDLIINGISTKRYKDRDWDSYRNHTIGFVFQSYNLIPHQSVLSNVELALTISGISRRERRARARAALESVGLGDQLHKRPNQMSGGQMQRVAIARALVNNPDILLADEPTGALDSETSTQVMALLKEVAKDRLVVMVTHNAELAETYATRIVKLRDGRITDDSDPYPVDEAQMEAARHANMGKASMSLLTALSLSFHNLRTKKGRTFLTAFAGSIGIIGIALILSLSNGANQYIADIQRSTMLSYPITIEAETFDFSGMFQAGLESALAETDHPLDGVYSNGRDLEQTSLMTASVTHNNLTSFKRYLDDPGSEIQTYIGENGVVYSYDTPFGVYTRDPEGAFVNTDGSTLESNKASNSTVATMLGRMNAMASNYTELFEELMPGQDEGLISPAFTENHDLVYGAWPQAYDEVALILDEQNEISTQYLYQLGILPTSEYQALMERMENGETIKEESIRWDYADICSHMFYLVPACDTYVENETGTFTCIADDAAQMEDRMEEGIPLRIVGVIRPSGDNAAMRQAFGGGIIGYTKALTDHLIHYADESAVVQAQRARKTVNVLNGLTFEPKDDAAKIEDTKTYLRSLGVTEQAQMALIVMQQAEETEEETGDEPAMPSYGTGVPAAPMSAPAGEWELASMLDAYLEHPDEDKLLEFYDTYISPGSYDGNLEDFGVVSLDAPSGISIYADSFEAKDAISACIESYNAAAEKEDQISYTDYVGLLMSSVTTMINVISYVLIAFVAISLVVSSIMIGIITYISVLERTKEIGVLRAIGASKRNVSHVFNAETFIIGLIAGLIGLGITFLLLWPINAIIHALAGISDINAALPWVHALVLMVLSVVLTLIGGLIPSRKAANKDPVAALRTE